MSLKAVYSSESEIPEELSQHYKKMADGSYKLQLEGEMKTQADVDRVKDTLQKERDENEDLKRQLSDVPDDFDPEKWDKVKDIDPDQDFDGELDEEAEQEIQKRVTERVREKERELKEDYKSKLDDKDSEIEQRKQTLAKQHKESWIKSQLAEEFGFNDQKRLRWMMLDIEHGQHPELKSKIDAIEAVYEEGTYQIKGGDLKDKQGAFDILENVSQMDVVKDYKPASDNSGGGAGNGGDGDDTSAGKLKKEDGTLNRTVAGQMYKENKDKAKLAVRNAGFDPKKVFAE